jgi:hypothetical protein
MTRTISRAGLTLVASLTALLAIVATPASARTPASAAPAHRAATAVTNAASTPVTPSWAGVCVNGCFGANPQDLCNGDGVRAAANTIYGVYIELRYSPSCQANWARVQNLPSGWTFFAKDAWGNVAWDGYGNSSTYRWTGMVDGSRIASACFVDVGDHKNCVSA